MGSPFGGMMESVVRSRLNRRFGLGRAYVPVLSHLVRLRRGVGFLCPLRVLREALCTCLVGSMSMVMGMDTPIPSYGYHQCPSVCPNSSHFSCPKQKLRFEGHTYMGYFQKSLPLG